MFPTMRIHPFAALRPRPDVAGQVASVPYDVVDRAESAELAAGNPLSFLHVVRAEIDVPDDVSAYDDRVYAQAAKNLEKLVADGVLVREDEPALFAYRLIMDGIAQTGLVGCVHIDDYENDLIKKHEKTRPEKEDDRTRHILELDADAEPVILTHRSDESVRSLLAAASQAEPLLDFVADDGVQHTVWRCANTPELVAAFAAVPCSYVADGHHRCASAWRAGCELRKRANEVAGDEEFHWFPAVLFPSDELRILAYNRVVRHELTSADVLARLAEVGTVTPTTEAAPAEGGTFVAYVDGAWHRVTIDPASIDSDDPIRSLDCDLLQQRVLAPIFGIDDPRTDKRIDFVGGIRGTTELERRCSEPGTVAFSMYPTHIDQLLAVADAGTVMPPKSTWFEPKLRSGLFVHTLDS